MTTARPSSVESERALLGAVLKRPDILDACDLEPDHFWASDHAKLWELMRSMHSRGDKIDLVTVSEMVCREGTAAYGGVDYVQDHAHPKVCTTTANWDHYAKIVRRDSALRKILDVCERASGDVQGGRDPLHVMDEVRRGFDGLSVSEATTWHHVSEVGKAARDTWEAREKGEVREKMPLGVAGLDRALEGGASMGDLIILAARPSMGKTALATEIAVASPLATGDAVGIVEMEMSKQALYERMTAQQSSVRLNTVKSGRGSAEEWEDIIVAGQALDSLSIFMDCRGGQTIATLRAAAFRLDRDARNKGHAEGLSLLVIDYLQLINCKGENRNVAVAELSRSLKSLAMDLDCVVLCLSQLNRKCEQRQDKRPMMSDLRDSGAIEQDADIILFMYRDDYYNHDTRHPGVTEVIIAKHRNGALGVVPLAWRGECTGFSEPTSDQAIRWRADNAPSGDVDGVL